MSSRRSNLVYLRIATLKFSSLAEHCHTQIIQVVSTPSPYFPPPHIFPLPSFSFWLSHPNYQLVLPNFFSPPNPTPNFMPIFPEEKFPQKALCILVCNFTPTSKCTVAVCVTLRHFSYQILIHKQKCTWEWRLTLTLAQLLFFLFWNFEITRLISIETQPKKIVVVVVVVIGAVFVVVVFVIPVVDPRNMPLKFEEKNQIISRWDM